MQAKVSSRRWDLIVALATAGLSVVIGMASIVQPAIAWLLVAGAVGVVLLQAPSYIWACVAVVAVVFSRLLVAWGIAPGFVNFLHFPFALGAGFLAAVAPSRRPSRALNRLGFGIVGLGIITVISWIANGGEFLRPVLVWLLFAEPFLIIYAIARTAPPKKSALLASLAMGLALVQVPFAFWQASTLGLGDPVQGTLIEHGAGAHVAGAIALLGIIALASRSLAKTGITSVKFLPMMILLFAVPVLADAKQSIIAFIPSVGVLLLGYGRPRLRGLLTALGVGSIIVAAGILYKPLRMATDLDLVLAGLGGKVLSYEIVAERMLESPFGLVGGLGPGNSVSRAALAAQEGYVRSLPGGWVDLQLSPTTAEILSSTAGFYLFASSSVWSGVSSWLGLFGDLGLAGVAVYLWMLWWVWRGLSGVVNSWAHTAKAALVMGVVLGAIFSWLETPEFTLPWALYIATGLVATRHENLPGP